MKIFKPIQSQQVPHTQGVGYAQGEAKRSPVGRRDGLPPMKPMAVEQAAGGVARRRSPPRGGEALWPNEARPTKWPVDEVPRGGFALAQRGQARPPMGNFIVLLFLLAVMTTACAPASQSAQVEPTTAQSTQTEPTGQSGEANTITLMSHDSFDASPEVIAVFEQANNVKIEFLRVGDAGAALNQAILSKENPLADVFFGVDNTFFSRAIDSGIFEPYASPMLADIPAGLKLDPENRLLPVDYGDVCLNYDKGWFEEKGLTPPSNLEDLLKDEYKGLTVVENPATSSPGLAFLLATVAHFGDPGYLDFWKNMKAQDVLVVDGWEDAYYGQFTRYEGTRPLVVSYASSPPVEVYFADPPVTEAPTAAVIGAEACFRQIEFIGILVGTQKRAIAEKLVDFLLSQQFQEDIPLKMFVFPANQKAALPDVFKKHAQLSPNPATLPPADIATKREEWINAWNEVVLR